ncbi:hypothetical protein [Mycobacterium sp. SMC-4]|uniref:hypothetical protein n=1 Tax=Mycobacterium sp. SMC-4 TaxID=2857059 RepID=UPI003CFC70B1
MVEPITAADTWSVAEFLHAEFSRQGLRRARAAAEWRRAMSPPWDTEQPNRGYFMHDNGRVVGAYLALYSERNIDGQLHRICNLGVWCVAEEHRATGLKMLRALLRQRGYTFTDLTPNPHVKNLNTRLGFSELDTTTSLVPNVPWPLLSRKVRVVDDRDDILNLLSGSDAQIFRDHSATTVHHAVLTDGEKSCHVMFRRDKYRGFRVFGTVLYVSSHELFRQFQSHFYRYLSVRLGIPATLVETRVVGHRPAGSVSVPGRPKMYISHDLAPENIDYLYSELMCLD